MKRFTFFLLILFTFLFLGFIYWWDKNSEPVSSDTSLKNFIVAKGKSASEIGEQLYKERLIRNPLAFKIYVQVSGKSNKIQAGEFKLSQSYSLKKVLDTLSSGPTELWVIIPEGMRREEIRERFVSGLEMSSDKANLFREEFDSSSDKEEGFLFPDSYLFPKDASASLIIKRMKEVFSKKVSGELLNEISKKGKKINDVVILASIIERETKSGEERPVVAGILYKRLEAGWPLQVDATVQYAVASKDCRGRISCEWWPILTQEDLKINSPFNSYILKGLPPSPIANPGISSIKAAVYPIETPYWFYIHDSKGQIHYATTSEEHYENINKYLAK